MPIERKSKTYAFNTPPEEVEGSPMDNPGEEMAEGEGEGAPQGGTATLPTSILQGKTVNPGDVVRLEVVSSDPESGMVTVRYATSKPEMM